MILLTPYLLGLPESQATETNNAQGRKLARTTDGRDVLRRFARMVSWLTETEDAHRAAERAWTAD